MNKIKKLQLYNSILLEAFRMSFNKINILASSILIYLVIYDFLFFNLEDIFNTKLYILKYFLSY